MNKISKYIGGLILTLSLAVLTGVGMADAARFSLSPASGNLNVGCEVALNIMIDTEGQSAMGADALIKFDPAKVEIVEIRDGDVFDAYPGKLVNLAEGKIYLTAFNMFSTYKTEGGADTYGVIVLKPKAGFAGTTLSFDFTLGSTIDSNISDSLSNDILTSVGNGNYTFIDTGFCGVDSAPPVVSNVFPASGSRDNPLNSNITFDVSDSLSGVNIDTVVVDIDGVEYRNGGAGFSFSGNALKYSVTVNPTVDFLNKTPVFVEIDAKDKAGNAMPTYSYSFNHPILDKTPPFVSRNVPVGGATGVALDADISFHIQDLISGVNVNSIKVNINGNLYEGGVDFSPAGGTANDYLILIDPVDDFVDGEAVYVEIEAKDIDGNAMSTYRYSFNHPVVDNDPPYVTRTIPSSGQRGVALDANITFHVEDDISGVDSEFLTVSINGVSYHAGEDFVPAGGDSSDYYISIDPVNDFVDGAPVYVTIDVRDFDGNVMPTVSYSFNHPIPDREPPYVTSPSPQPGVRGVSLDTNITFLIKDNLSGVDMDTVYVVLNEVVYSNGDSEFSYSGDATNYFVTVNPSADFLDGEEIVVEIDAKDLSGNVMNTYIYKFNRPSVCGDDLVELNEGCEPPGTSACDENCNLTICWSEPEEFVEGICGNGVVEQGEECEPPNTSTCNMNCFALPQFGEIETEVVGAPEEGEISKYVGYLQLVNRENEKIIIMDSDGDGISDEEEVLDYGSDPNDPATIDFSTRIINWKNGDITGSKKLFVKGVSYADKNVKVFATSDSGTQFFLGETVADLSNKFAVISQVDLEEGDYFLEARSYEESGELINESDTVRITIDYKKRIAAPKIEAIEDVPVIKGVKIVIFDNQPMVFGSTAPNSQVFVVFESLMFTSTVLSDSPSGFFTVFAPNPLEYGLHRVTVYAISSEGVISDFDVVEFEIREQKEPFFVSFNWWWLLLLVPFILMFIYWVVRKFSATKNANMCSYPKDSEEGHKKRQQKQKNVVVKMEGKKRL